MAKKKKKISELGSYAFGSAREINGVFNYANVSKLKDSILKYSTLLKNAAAFRTGSNSDEYNFLLEELDSFDELAEEFLSVPEKELNEKYFSIPKEQLTESFLSKRENAATARIVGIIEDLKDNLEAIRIRADLYSNVKVEQRANETRTRRIALADMLSDFVIDLERKGLNENSASAVFPLEDEEIINAESEATAKDKLKNICNNFRLYLEDSDVRSPLTFSGNSSDTYRKSYLLQTGEELQKQIETYQAERTRKDSSLVHKNDSVLDNAFAQLHFINAGLQLREAIDKVENAPEGADMSALESERDKCLLRMSMMMAYAGKTGWQNIKEDIPKKISEYSLKEILDVMHDNNLSLLFNDNSLPGKNQKMKAYKNAGIEDGTLPEEIKFTYDGKKFKCDVPTSNYKSLTNILGLKRFASMKDSYIRSQEYWLTSTYSNIEEAQSRKMFVDAHREELDRLYGYIQGAVKSGKDIEKVRRLLEKEELTDLISDYCLLTAKGIDDPVRDILKLDDKLADFPYYEDALGQQSKAVLMTKEGKESVSCAGRLTEFHKWMYRNCDSAAGGFMADFLGSEGSARPFVEEFLREAPYTQLKTLYVIEHGLKRNDIKKLNNDDLKNYTPDLNKLKKKIVEPKIKFWKRFSGNKHRWNLIRDSLLDVKKHEAAQIIQSNTKIKGHDVSGTIPAFREDLMPKEKSDSMFAADISEIMEGIQNGNIESMLAGVLNTVDDGLSMTTGNASAIMDISGVSNAFQRGLSSVGEAGDIVSLVNSAVTLVRGYAKKGEIEMSQKLTGMIRPEQFETLTPDQKELFNKLKKHQTTALLEHDVDLHKNTITAVTTVAFIVGGVLAEVACPFIGAVSLAALPIYKMVCNKMDAKETRAVVDNEIYKNPDDKKSKLKKLKDKINERFNSKGKAFRDKYRKMKDTFVKDEDNLASTLRQKTSAKSGFVNLSEFKEYLVNSVGNDLYDSLNKMKESEFSMFNDRSFKAKDYKKDVLSDSELDLAYLDKSDSAKLFAAIAEKAVDSVVKGLGLDSIEITVREQLNQARLEHRKQLNINRKSTEIENNTELERTL